jgi:hypothetical protein
MGGVESKLRREFVEVKENRFFKVLNYILSIVVAFIGVFTCITTFGAVILVLISLCQQDMVGALMYSLVSLSASIINKFIYS